MSEARKIPVTVLTGFLGAGKTTLLNRILAEQHGLRIAVIENEFGEVGIDHELVINADEEIFEMNNGCICCTVRGDLIRILGNLMQRRDRFDQVLIETTGLADPAPVAQTFFLDDEIRAAFRLDGIVTLVDARHVTAHLDDSDECQQQIAFADRILLNKIDLVTPEELAAVERRIRAMNASARIHRTRDAGLPIPEILGIHAFDLGTKLEIDPSFLQPELPFEWSGAFDLPAGRSRLVFEPGPDAEIDLALLPAATDVDKDEVWEQQASRAARAFVGDPARVARGGAVVPGEGLQRLELGESGTTECGIEAGGGGRFTLHLQHHPDEFRARVLHGDRALEPFRAEAHAPGHEHDDSVSSVGIVEEGSMNPARLNEWLGALLREKGADIFRMKGILDVAGSPARVVFQGVHMLFDARVDRPWRKDERRVNQMVFIGRNLDRGELLEGFRRCRN